MKTASQIVESYKAKTEVEVDYDSLSKEALIEIIKDLKSRVHSKTVNELVITLLLDPDYLDASNISIAEAVRLLIPGSETTSKSVSSIRSVYNKGILAREANKLDPSLSPRDRAIALAELEYDLMDKGLLIKPRQ